MNKVLLTFNLVFELPDGEHINNIEVEGFSEQHISYKGLMLRPSITWEKLELAIKDSIGWSGVSDEIANDFDDLRMQEDWHFVSLKDCRLDMEIEDDSPKH